MANRQNPEYQYDVFISHNSDDRLLAETLAARLEDDANLHPFLDKWHLVPGEPWQEALESALDNSVTCIVLLGSNGLGPWENEELRSFLDERVRNRSLRVIPVLLPGANPKDPLTLPRFLRRLTWVDFRSGLDDGEAFDRLVAGIRGEVPGRSLAARPRPRLKPMIVHPLPPAPFFIGRARELRALHDYWNSGWSGVLALIGLGGAGKTAIVEQFLSQLLSTKENPADGLFIWSFYIDQDVDAFLHDAFRYFSGRPDEDMSTRGMLHLLMDTLSNGGRYLIVMDGLERIQHLHNDADGIFGDLEDTLLNQAISRLALGVGKTTCLITSRFPVSSLHLWRGKGYEVINVDQLEHEDARALLRTHGLQGEEATLDQVIDEYGRHALTLDYLSTYLAEFRHGILETAESLEEPKIESDVREERKLARVFSAYEKSLNDKELALLSRLCIFRFGTTLDVLHSIFGRGEPKGRFSKIMRVFSTDYVGGKTSVLEDLTKIEFKQIMNHLIALHLVLTEAEDRYTVHPTVRDHFYNLFAQGGKVRTHTAIMQYFATLSQRPGTVLPEDKRTLDLLEELVYQAIQAGEIGAAKDIYQNRLGGVKHLGFQLGEFSRGLRILNLFPKCPDHSDMAHYLFNFGDLEGAKQHFRSARQIVDALMMFQGFLARARQVGKGFPTRVGTVDFLMGTSKLIPSSDQWVEDLPFMPAELYLWLGEISGAERRVRQTRRLWEGNKWYDVLPRCELVEAEILERRGSFDEALDLLQKTLSKLLKNGTASWICAYHRSASRIFLSKGDLTNAQSSLREGLHLAGQCGFTLYHIDMLTLQARICLMQGRPEEAERVSLDALNGVVKHSRQTAPHFDLPIEQLALLGAKHPECQYAWGAAAAGALLGEALLVEDRASEALNILNETLKLQESISDPRAKLTVHLLRSAAT